MDINVQLRIADINMDINVIIVVLSVVFAR